MKTISQRLNEPDGIAARLRSLRVEASLNSKTLAGAAGWVPSKVTKIERGKQSPSVADIEAWVRVCGADQSVTLGLVNDLRALHAEHSSWQRRLRSGQAAVQTAYTRLVADATSIRYFETTVIPGMLQTPPYARRLLLESMELAGITPVDIDDAVAARMQRAQYLYDTSKQFEFLLAESVLSWQTAPPEIMRPQLDRLHAIIGMPNVRFGIYPYHAARHMVPANAFQIRDDFAIVDTFGGEITYRGQEARAYGTILDRLWANAIEGEPARELVTKATRAA